MNAKATSSMKQLARECRTGMPFRTHRGLIVVPLIAVMVILSSCGDDSNKSKLPTPTALSVLDDGSSKASEINQDGSLTVCHATGNPNHPYDLLTVDSDQEQFYLENPEDIIPAPLEGCPGPGTPVATRTPTPLTATPGGTAPTPGGTLTVPPTQEASNGNNGNSGNGGGNGSNGDDGTQGDPLNNVSICHATGSGQNTYVQITVAESALPAHRAHGDIIPAPQGGCPGANTPVPVTPASSPTRPNATAVPRTPTNAPTHAGPTNTVPPPHATNTVVGVTATPVRPTNTPASAPTNTPIAPTRTTPPNPTNTVAVTPVPTNTSPLPTSTTAPSSTPPPPPTATPVPTSTSVPSSTPQPSATPTALPTGTSSPIAATATPAGTAMAAITPTATPVQPVQPTSEQPTPTVAP